MTSAQLTEMRARLDLSSGEHAAELSQAGRPTVGYFCHYVPPEIITAAGAVPLRLRGVGIEDSSLGDAYLSERVCTYVRHVMNQVLDGSLDDLAGVVCSNTCDHVRRAADLFREKAQIPFVGFVSVPRALREDLYPYYRRELSRLFEGLCEALGTEATGDALRAAIAEHNAVRRRLLRLGELRRREPPRLSGADALVVNIAAQVMPPATFLPWIDALLDALERAPALEGVHARVVLVGAELDEPRYLDVIEGQGALVVSDRLCFGERSVLELLDEAAAEPLDTLARAYFFQPSCARMIGDFPARWASLAGELERARADGIIFERLLFCDPWGAEQYNLSRRCRDAQVPLLSLNREYGIVPTGQLRTRVQAFVERIEIQRHRRVG